MSELITTSTRVLRARIRHLQSEDSVDTGVKYGGILGLVKSRIHR